MGSGMPLSISVNKLILVGPLHYEVLGETLIITPMFIQLFIQESFESSVLTFLFFGQNSH